MMFKKCLFPYVTSIALLSLPTESVAGSVDKKKEAIVNCMSDDQGPHDVTAGRRDLSEFCFSNDSTCGDFGIEIAWDESNDKTNKNLYACALFDKNDGNIDYAICFTAEYKDNKNEYKLKEARFYECNFNDQTDRCDGPVEVANFKPDKKWKAAGNKKDWDECESCRRFEDYETQCKITGNKFDCCIDYSDFNGVLGADDSAGNPAFFTEACSYASEDPDSNPDDCVYATTENNIQETAEVKMEETPQETVAADSPGVEEDPIIKGFRGQIFKFVGRTKAWYAILATKSLQWNDQFFEYPKCTKNVEGEYRAIEDRMFVTKTSVHLPGINQKISVEITTLNKQSPGCPEGKPNCLGNGTIALFIDGEKYDTPGQRNLKDGGRVVAHNFDWMCAHVQRDHFTEQTDKEFLKTKKKTSKDYLRNKKKRPYQSSRRRLSEEEKEEEEDYSDFLDQEIAIDLLLDKTHTKGVNDNEDCRKWLKDREHAKDLFDQPGKWSIFHIETSLLSLRLEYIYVEEGRNCHLRHLNTYVENISPELYNDGKWTGIAGETRYDKYTFYGSKVEKNRFMVLSSPYDEDYEVDGPFETDFFARHIDVSHTDDQISI